jgi:hypothetical protein
VYIVPVIVKKLLDAGSKLEYKDSAECTPLFHAVYSNKPAVTELMIRGKYLSNETCSLEMTYRMISIGIC